MRVGEAGPLGKMWNDDSSPYRSQPLHIRRQLESFHIGRRLPRQPRRRTPLQQRRAARDREMRDLRAQGWLLKQIAQRYKVSLMVASRVCRGVVVVR